MTPELVLKRSHRWKKTSDTRVSLKLDICAVVAWMSSLSLFASVSCFLSWFPPSAQFVTSSHYRRASCRQAKLWRSENAVCDEFALESKGLNLKFVTLTLMWPYVLCSLVHENTHAVSLKLLTITTIIIHVNSALLFKPHFIYHHRCPCLAHIRSSSLSLVMNKHLVLSLTFKGQHVRVKYMGVRRHWLVI